MSIPLPENTFDTPTLKRIDERRARYKSQCPRHPGYALVFWKELLVGATGDMHLVATGLYSDDCMATIALDTTEEPRFKER